MRHKNMPEEQLNADQVAAQTGGNVQEDFFSENNEVKAGFWTPEVGETIKGTYVEKVQIPPKGVYPAQIGYILRTDRGDMTCAFNVAKKFIHQGMNNARIGQIVGFKRGEDFETDAYKKDPEHVKPAHTVKVYLGKMDPAYNPDGLEEVSFA